MKKWIALLSVFFLSATVSFASHIEEVELERLYTEKAQRAVDGVYGSGLLVVRVDVELGDDSWSVKYTEQAKVKLEKREDTKKEEKVLILPGYPVLKNLSPDSLQQLPYNSEIVRKPSDIKTINVDVIVSTKFPNNQRAKAQKLITKVLELDKKRGDAISFDRQKFLAGAGVPPTQNIIIAGEDQKLFSINNILDMALVALLLIGLGVYAFFSMKSLKQGESSGGGGGDSPNISVNPSLELPKSGGGSGGRMKLTQTAPVKQYFDFVSEDNIEKLMFVLKKDSTPIEQVGVVVSFLEPRLASQLLSEYDINDQAKIGTMIIDAQMLKRPVLDKIESKIKDSLECLTGGQSVFKDVFDYIPSEIKKQILSVLGKTDPKGYKNFRANVVILDDIKFLTDEELKIVFSDANLEMLSKALVGVAKDVYEKIYSNLNPSAKDMVEQFLKLKGQSVSKTEVDKAQAYIIDIVLKLENDGQIKLREKIGNK